MATDRTIQAEREKKFPALWHLTEAFLKKYRGAVHINWGAPFSVRTKVAEGRLEVDFTEGQLRVRFDNTAAPPSVSFTNDPDLFSGYSFNENIGNPAAQLGWQVQGGDGHDASATCAFLQAAGNIEDLKRLELVDGDSISIQEASVYLVLRTAEFARLDAVIQGVRRMLQRFAAGTTPVARPPRVRVTGKSPSPAQLQKWPNWSHCLDEEDGEGQDETTLRPDTEQGEIGPSTILTALTVEAPGQRVLVGSLLGDRPGGDLREASPGVVTVFDGKSARTVLVEHETWRPDDYAKKTVRLDDTEWVPMTVRTVLAFSDGRRLEWVLEPGGTMRVVGP